MSKGQLEQLQATTRAKLAEYSADETVRRLAHQESRRLEALNLSDVPAVLEDCSTLHGFVRRAWFILEPGRAFIDGWHIAAICDHLEAVSRGEIKKLLINVPPGTMKSLLASVFWPAWEWGPGGKPFMRYLTTSYELGLAIRDNRKMRQLVESDWFRQLWPAVRMSEDQNAKGKFENTSLGVRDGRAFDSTTGARGDRIIIDDPHSVTSAESDEVRAKVVDTFRTAMPSRTNGDDSAFVVIMQRLHESDVSGTILADPQHMGYEHLMLPMEFEVERACRTSIGFEDPRTYEGELLLPQLFTPARIATDKRIMGDYAVAGQFQQRPAPRSGGIFKVDRINWVDALPAGDRKTVRAWDFAASIPEPGKRPDWTASVRMSRDEIGRIYVEDVTRFQRAGLEAKEALVKAAKDDTSRVHVRYPQDPGQAGKAQAEDFARALAGYAFTFERPTGDKVTRATPFANQVEAGNVFVLKAPWNEAFIAELGSFPGGANDDQVDAGADAFSKLAGVMPGEGLFEYYRREAARANIILAGKDPDKTEEGEVRIVGPEGVGMLVGATGAPFHRGPDGTFTLPAEEAVPILLQPGWKAAD